jgi:hypothetical protein
MYVLKVLANAVIMAFEIGAVVGAAWLGYWHPFAFAAVTAALGFLMGLRLEAARLRNELPFYFDTPSRLRLLFVPFIGGVESLTKAVMAGLAALFTFAGTDHDRLFAVAVLFGLLVFLGANLLRWLSLRAGAHPARWGYFRLGAPLGLLFSAGLATLAALALVPQTTLSDLGWKMIWEVPAKPSLEQVSELVFQIKQAFDDFIVTLLSTVMSRDWARVVAVAASVNVLTGFVASLYASVIASIVRRAEERVW